jgi:uncharacterized protein
MNGLPRPVPFTDDPDTGGFWSAAERGELAVLTCTSCAAVIHLPRPICACGSAELDWRPTAGSGRVFSYTVVRHKMNRAFVVPYTVVLVQLEEYPDVRLTGYLPGEVAIEIDQPMLVVFESYGGKVVPNWIPQAVAPAAAAPTTRQGAA